MAVDTLAKWNVWHTATVDWTPTGVTYYLDGRKIGSSVMSPKTPMHLVLQTATTGVLPAARTAGHVLIDWVAIYRWKG
jgi:beta-glucanase (GH16 family)